MDNRQLLRQKLKKKLREKKALRTNNLGNLKETSATKRETELFTQLKKIKSISGRKQKTQFVKKLMESMSDIEQRELLKKLPNLLSPQMIQMLKTAVKPKRYVMSETIEEPPKNDE